MIYWFTGQPGSGKTTLAKELLKFLPENTFHIDGDDLRLIFKNKDYSQIGRKKNIERAQDIAKYLFEKGNSVVVSIVSPYKNQREEFKKHNLVIEIYVHTTEIRGRENYHVSDYEQPTEKFIDIDTTNKTVEESITRILNIINL